VIGCVRSTQSGCSWQHMHFHFFSLSFYTISTYKKKIIVIIISLSFYTISIREL
jgi:hypothetical protein